MQSKSNSGLHKIFDKDFRGQTKGRKEVIHSDLGWNKYREIEGHGNKRSQVNWLLFWPCCAPVQRSVFLLTPILIGFVGVGTLFSVHM